MAAPGPQAPVRDALTRVIHRCRPLARALALGALALGLGGCVLGPDYVRPEAAPQAMQQARLPRADAQLTPAAAPPHRWWDGVDDPLLVQLIDRALAHSPGLRAAAAKVDASRALVAQRRAERLPSVGATAAYAYVDPPSTISDGIRRTGGDIASAAEAAGRPEAAARIGQQVDRLDTNAQLYAVAADASWEPDFFGRRRRAQEEASATAQADAAELADAQVRLAAEVAQVYAQYRGTCARSAIATEGKQDAAQALALVQQRRDRGAATQMQVEQALARVQTQEATLHDLRQTRVVALDQLALLVGDVPGSLDDSLAADAPLPPVPEQVPVDDAAALIQRRPDVRQAERELAASSARIGQALSAYFPQVSLLGSIGMAATRPADLGAGALTALASPVLRWSAFDFGRTRALVARARAGNEAAEAVFDAKVLAALQDANGALARFGASRRIAVVAEQTVASADRTYALVGQRVQAGAASRIDALDVKRQVLQARDQQAQAQLKLFVDYAALQKSLGLGWDGAPAPGDAATDGARPSAVAPRRAADANNAALTPRAAPAAAIGAE